MKVTGHRTRSAPVLPSIERRHRYVPLQSVHADSDTAPLQSQPDTPARTGEWVASQPVLARLSMMTPTGLENIPEGNAEGSQSPSAHSRAASNARLAYSREASGLSHVQVPEDASEGMHGERQRSVFEVASTDTPRGDAPARSSGRGSRHASSLAEIDTQPSLVTAVATSAAPASTVPGAPPGRPTGLDASRSFKMVRDQLRRAAYEERCGIAMVVDLLGVKRHIMTKHQDAAVLPGQPCVARV